MEEDFTEQMVKNGRQIALLTPRTHQKYTSGILAKGFNQLGFDLVPLTDASMVLAVLTPTIESLSPHAYIDDSAAIVTLLEKAQRSKNTLELSVLLRPTLHSNIPLPHPDVAAASEIDRLLTTSALFGASVSVIDQLLQRECNSLRAPQNQIGLIPHGFFTAARPSLPSERVVVGTHSHPGERSDILRTLHTTLEVLTSVSPGTCFGYIGGKTTPQLTCEDALQIARTHFTSFDIEVVPNYFMVSDAHKKRVLVVSDQMWEPDEYCVTCDIRYIDQVDQSFHVESLHLRPSLPFVSSEFAERFLGGRPIFSYNDSIDQKPVRTLIESIQNKKVPLLLQRAERFAQENTPKKIAHQYLLRFKKAPVTFNFEESDHDTGVH
jgi:hypothetical protein